MIFRSVKKIHIKLEMRIPIIIIDKNSFINFNHTKKVK